jgi:hypothetical protein
MRQDAKLKRRQDRLLVFFPQSNKKNLDEHVDGQAAALQRTNADNSKQLFPEKELRGHSPNFHIHVSVSDLYIPTIDLPIYSATGNMWWTYPGNI